MFQGFMFQFETTTPIIILAILLLDDPRSIVSCVYNVLRYYSNISNNSVHVVHGELQVHLPYFVLQFCQNKPRTITDH